MIDKIFDAIGTGLSIIAGDRQSEKKNRLITILSILIIIVGFAFVIYICFFR